MSYELLKTLVDVNVETGTITPKSGVLMFRRMNCKYRVITINKETYFVHKVVMAFKLGYWPKDLVDHINRNTEDNRGENLREATYSDNSCNRGMRSDNTLGYKGIFKRQLKRKVVYGWMIKLKGEAISRSGFSTPEAAYADRCKNLIVVHGEFANPG